MGHINFVGWQEMLLDPIWQMSLRGSEVGFHEELWTHACTWWQVVNVWEFGKGRHRRRLTLKKSLFGHSEAVTCLSASPAYNIIVSGSRDRTCIIWDLNELVFVRQLRGHTAPVAAVAVNELTVSNSFIRLLYCITLLNSGIYTFICFQ